MKSIPLKIIILIFNILMCMSFTVGQTISSHIEIITTYSQDEKFYLKSIPYDNESPSLRGKTSVYKTDSATPLYEFDRGFDSVGKNELILSNNGEVIFYLINWGAEEEKEGLKSITIYKKGKIFKSFTKAQITGCDENKERCDLIYSNFDEVVDKAKSGFGTRNYKKAFKNGVDEKERFLSDYPIFSYEDTVYLIDSKKRIHLFDLKEGNYLDSDSFNNIFERIKNKGRVNKTKAEILEAPYYSDFPKLKNGKNTFESLAINLGMKMASIVGTKDDPYKIYRFAVSGMISKDGSFELEKIDIDEELPKEKIIEFFKINKFDTSSAPKELDKWYISDEYFYFRNKDDILARQEKQLEEIKEREALKSRLTAERINNIYIPKNLEESFLELDKLLKEIDKKEMQSLKKRDDMIQYHMGLGMWMRNNWGLWSGSRLQKYFTVKKITHPDDMSSVILHHYYDWLNGKKETWKDWEKKTSLKRPIKIK